jgi:hypothetical protein
VEWLMTANRTSLRRKDGPAALASP